MMATRFEPLGICYRTEPISPDLSPDGSQPQSIQPEGAVSADTRRRRQYWVPGDSSSGEDEYVLQWRYVEHDGSLGGRAPSQPGDGGPGGLYDELERGGEDEELLAESHRATEAFEDAYVPQWAENRPGDPRVERALENLDESIPRYRDASRAQDEATPARRVDTGSEAGTAFVDASRAERAAASDFDQDSAEFEQEIARTGAGGVPAHRHWQQVHERNVTAINEAVTGYRTAAQTLQSTSERHRTGEASEHELADAREAERLSWNAYQKAQGDAAATVGLRRDYGFAEYHRDNPGDLQEKYTEFINRPDVRQDVVRGGQFYLVNTRTGYDGRGDDSDVKTPYEAYTGGLATAHQASTEAHRAAYRSYTGQDPTGDAAQNQGVFAAETGRRNTATQEWGTAG